MLIQFEHFMLSSSSSSSNANQIKKILFLSFQNWLFGGIEIKVEPRNSRKYTVRFEMAGFHHRCEGVQDENQVIYDRISAFLCSAV